MQEPSLAAFTLYGSFQNLLQMLENGETHIQI